MNAWEPGLMVFLFSIQFLLIVVLFIIVIALIFQFKKRKRLFQRLMEGTRRENLEQLLERLITENGQLKEDQAIFLKKFEGLAKEVSMKKSNIGFVRFNAFDLEGSDLSFSLAMVDDYLNGFVLTSIYGRDESRIYAKPLSKGVSEYQLSPEEQEAVNRVNSKTLLEKMD